MNIPQAAHEQAAASGGNAKHPPGQHPGAQHPLPPAATAPADKAAKAKRAPTEYVKIKLSDGREVDFAGKKKMNKTVLYSKDLETWHDEDPQDGDQYAKVRFDFRNGETREFSPPDSLLIRFIGHGASQKIGDETAGEEDVDDMVVAVDAIIDKLNAGSWSTREPGESFGGASVVIKALMEASGKTMQEIKAYLQGKLDAAKAKGESLSRAALYASFRNPKSKVGQIVRRMEEEKAAKATKIDADAELAAGLQV
jgi:hypothetical protein